MPSPKSRCCSTSTAWPGAPPRQQRSTAGSCYCFFFQAEDGIRDTSVTGVQTCALPICSLWLCQGTMPPGFICSSRRRKVRPFRAKIGRASCRERVGDRLAAVVGLKDAIDEGVAAGASGWGAGLVNAFTEESVLLYEHGVAGRAAEAAALYRWFLLLFFFSSRRRHTRYIGDGSSDVCSSDLLVVAVPGHDAARLHLQLAQAEGAAVQG